MCSLGKRAVFSMAVGWALMVAGSVAARFDDVPPQPAGEPLTAWQWMQAVSVPAPATRLALCRFRFDSQRV